MAAANNMHASAGTDTPANSDLSRIATALERIATAIEAQTESVELGFSMLSNRIEDLAGCIPPVPDWLYEPPKASVLPLAAHSHKSSQAMQGCIRQCLQYGKQYRKPIMSNFRLIDFAFR